MAISANTAWEVRTTGSDSNGGGFVTGASGSDFSQQNTAQATLTTASVVNATTTKITVAAGDYTVTANDVGNIFQLTSGTATAGFYQITAVDTVANTWTLDRGAGTAGQTTAGAMGGALLSPAIATKAATNGNQIFIKSGTYSITSTSNNVAGGVLSPVPGVVLVGYNTTRSYGNTDTKPVLHLDVASGTIFAGSDGSPYNLTLDGNATGKLSSGSGTFVLVNCLLKNFSANATCALSALGCEITANTIALTNSAASVLVGCEIHGNTATLAASLAMHCLVYGNTGATTDGLTLPTNAQAVHCIFYNNGRDGIRTSSSNAAPSVVQNCHAEANAGVGYNAAVSGHQLVLVSCGDYNNTGGRSAATGTVTDLHPLALSGTAFTNAAGADFSLNNNASEGALLRGAGYITATGDTYPTGTTTSHLDVGAAQTTSGGGGGGGGAWAFA